MSFKTFCFLVFVSCAYSTSILEESIGYREEEKVPSAASAACPEGWIESVEGCFNFANTGEERKRKQNKVYLVFAATGLTWREGQELCENLGAHLAEIKSEEQNTFLVSLAKLEENLIDTQSWQIGEQWSGFRYLQIASFTLNKFNLLEKLYKLDKLFPL